MPAKVQGIAERLSCRCGQEEILGVGHSRFGRGQNEDEHLQRVDEALEHSFGAVDPIDRLRPTCCLRH